MYSIEVIFAGQEAFVVEEVHISASMILGGPGQETPEFSPEPLGEKLAVACLRRHTHYYYFDVLVGQEAQEFFKVATLSLCAAWMLILVAFDVFFRIIHVEVGREGRQDPFAFFDITG